MVVGKLSYIKNAVYTGKPKKGNSKDMGRSNPILPHGGRLVNRFLETNKSLLTG